MKKKEFYHVTMTLTKRLHTGKHFFWPRLKHFRAFFGSSSWEEKYLFSNLDLNFNTVNVG